MDKNIIKIKQIFEKEKFYVDEEKLDIDGNDEVKLSVLVELDGRDPENGLLLEMLLVPGVDEEIDGCSLLQFFIEFRNDLNLISEDTFFALMETIATYNYNLPLGTYGVHPENNILYYKHMMILPKEIGKDMESAIIQTIWMICYVQNQCYPSLEKILSEAEV